MILSIIVISHNQREQLKRCLDTLLAQSLPFEHEIIISDDASNDGTWNVAQDYASRYSQIRAYSCNTTEFAPANASERCSWNKCNAYQYATGKYIAHVDGDDFFLEGKDIYKKQVELLEQNPSCSCCMANMFGLNENEDVSKVRLSYNEKFQTGEILSSGEYIRNYFRQFQCFVFRRNTDINPAKILGRHYNDCVITDFNIQCGDIVCLNDAGYVLVRHKSSIWSQQIESGDNVAITPALFIPLLIPKWKYDILSSPKHLSAILNVVKLVQSGHRLREGNFLWVQRYDSYLYHAFNRNLSYIDTIHLKFLSLYIRVLRKFRFSIKFPYKVLFALI